MAKRQYRLQYYPNKESQQKKIPTQIMRSRDGHQIDKPFYITVKNEENGEVVYLSTGVWKDVRLGLKVFFPYCDHDTVENLEELLRRKFNVSIYQDIHLIDEENKQELEPGTRLPTKNLSLSMVLEEAKQDTILHKIMNKNISYKTILRDIEEFFYNDDGDKYPLEVMLSNIYYSEDDGRNSLMQACYAGYDRVVEIIISDVQGYDPERLEIFVNAQDRDGNTALHYCMNHELDSDTILKNVNILLESAANCNLVNSKGETPLITFFTKEDENRCLSHFLEIAKRLVKCTNVNTVDNSGRTALIHLVLLMKHQNKKIRETVRYLLENGADPNLGSQTALVIACQIPSITVEDIKLLLEFHADITPEVLSRISNKNVKEFIQGKIDDSDDYNEGDVDVYNGPTDQKWESDLNEMNQLFLSAIKTNPFTKLLRLKSFGIDKQRISDHQLIHHPILNDFFEVTIECANNIMENVVFNVYGNKLTKDPKRRGIFAFTCLIIAFKQQGAFDWVYDRSDFAHYFSSVLQTPKEKMNKLELKLLMLTNWEGCKEISERMEMKTYRKYDELFQIGKKKSVRKSKGKKIKKSLRKKRVKTR